MRKLLLTQGKIALLDDSDFELFSIYKWRVSFTGSNYYAIRNKGNKTIYLHREMTNCPKGMQVDHINHDTLDNRRENIRIVSTSQNLMNRGRPKNNKSGYLGVSWDKGRKKWRAQICVNKNKLQLGYYSNIQAAWLARRWGERLYHGDYRRMV